MKKRLRSPAVLLVATAMVLVAAGIGYAHWFTSTSIVGQVNTGNLQMGWDMVGTDDDGQPEAAYPGDGGGGTDFDYWGPESSNDPSSPTPGVRESKDVAGCWAGQGEESVINWNIENGYPSYYCHVYAKAVNHGSVPVKAAGLTVWAEKGYWTSHFNADFSDEPLDQYWSGDNEGEFLDINMNGTFDGGDQRIEHDNDGPYADNNDNDVFDAGDQRIYNAFNGFGMTLNPTGIDGEFLLNDELKFNIVEGITCGTQVDPGEEGVQTSGWLHVEQPADPNTTYMLHLEQEWVNWNEWDVSLCTFTGL